MAITNRGPAGSVLLRHVLKVKGAIPHPGRITGIPREIRTTRECIRSIDRPQQKSGSGRGCSFRRPPRSRREGPCGTTCDEKSSTPATMTSGLPVRCSELAPRIAGQPECDLCDPVTFRPVEPSHLDAVVGVNLLSVRKPGIILSECVLVEHQFQPLLGHVQNLASRTGIRVVLTIRIATVDKPRFDLQLISGKPLDTNSIEKPGRVGRYVGRLISPVVKVIVGE